MKQEYKNVQQGSTYYLFTLLLLLYVLIRVTLSQKTVAGALNNEKKRKAVSAVILECQSLIKVYCSNIQLSNLDVSEGRVG